MTSLHKKPSLSLYVSPSSTPSSPPAPPPRDSHFSSSSSHTTPTASTSQTRRLASWDSGSGISESGSNSNLSSLSHSLGGFEREMTPLPSPGIGGSGRFEGFGISTSTSSKNDGGRIRGNSIFQEFRSPSTFTSTSNFPGSESGSEPYSSNLGEEESTNRSREGSGDSSSHSHSGYHHSTPTREIRIPSSSSARSKTLSFFDSETNVLSPPPNPPSRANSLSVRGSGDYGSSIGSGSGSGSTGTCSLLGRTSSGSWLERRDDPDRPPVLTFAGGGGGRRRAAAIAAGARQAMLEGEANHESPEEGDVRREEESSSSSFIYRNHLPTLPSLPKLDLGDAFPSDFVQAPPSSTSTLPFSFPPSTTTPSSSTHSTFSSPYSSNLGTSITTFQTHHSRPLLSHLETTSSPSPTTTNFNPTPPRLSNSHSYSYTPDYPLSTLPSGVSPPHHFNTRFLSPKTPYSTHHDSEPHVPSSSTLFATSSQHAKSPSEPTTATTGRSHRPTYTHAKRDSTLDPVPREGDLIGSYQVIKLLGKGAFSRVTLARDRMKEEGGRVALKLILKKSYEGNERMRISVSREVDVLKHIHHPSLISLTASFLTPLYTVLVLDYAPGGELFDFLASWHSQLTVPLARRIFGELCAAVGWMHEIGLVHRDIKLENILLTYRPFPTSDPSTLLTSLPTPFIKLTDFGLSRFISPTSPLLSTRCGSEAYAAPELIMGKKYDGRKTDAWALGVVLYSIIVGGLPFVENEGNEGRGRRGFLMRIAKGEYGWPEEGSLKGEGQVKIRDSQSPLSPERPPSPLPSTTPTSTSSSSSSHLISPSAKSLIQSLLTRDASKRLEVKHVWDSDWMKFGEGRPERLRGWISEREEGDLDEATRLGEEEG